MNFYTKIIRNFGGGGFRRRRKMSPAEVGTFGFLAQFNNPRYQFETTLTNIRKLSSDSYIYTYALPNPDLPLGLVAGHHVIIYGPNRSDVARKYTPISPYKQKGTFDILIKIYRPNSHPDFPEGGALTPHLEAMKIGDKVMMSGPKFKKTYLGHGKFNFMGTEFHSKEIAMIAGGVGIAPIYQIVQALREDPTDQTKLHILFSNKSEEDIVMKEELDEAAKDPRIKVHYTITRKAPENWKGFIGYVSKEMLQQTMPKPSDDVAILVCGPESMQDSVGSQFRDLGYDMNKAIII